MSKFNMNSLMNDKSKKEIDTNTYKVIYINIKDIHISENNFYKTDDITELKESIELVGLRQHIEVWDNNGTYEIISGHRRFKALKELCSEGKKEFEKIPCRVVECTETEAEIQLIFGNSVNRELTDYEKMFQLSRMKELLEKWQNEGEKIPGRKRDIIAEKLNMSKSQVGRLESIENNLSDDLKEEFKKENINLTTAVELSKLDKEKQVEQLKKIQIGEKVTAKTVIDENKNVSIMDTKEKEIDDDTNIVFENQIGIDDSEGNLNTESILPKELENQVEKKSEEQKEKSNVPTMDTRKIERVFISNQDKQGVIEVISKKYNGKLSVISDNIEKYRGIGREPNKNDLDEQLEYQIIVNALEIYKRNDGE